MGMEYDNRNATARSEVYEQQGIYNEYQWYYRQ